MNETLAVDELEELLHEKLPCGGNIWPVTRPCPHDNEAVVVNRHRACNPCPQDFKCYRCLYEYMYSHPGSALCKCGMYIDPVDLYRQL